MHVPPRGEHGYHGPVLCRADDRGERAASVTLRSNPCVRFRTSARRTLGALTLALLPSTWACSAADEPDAAFGGSPGQSGTAGAPAPSGGTTAGLGGAPFRPGATAGAPTTGGSSTGRASGNGGAPLGRPRDREGTRSG